MCIDLALDVLMCASNLQYIPLSTHNHMTISIDTYYNELDMRHLRECVLTTTHADMYQFKEEDNQLMSILYLSPPHTHTQFLCSLLIPH